MIDISHYEAWFITGSQHLYGPETLEQVAQHSQQIAARTRHPAAHQNRVQARADGPRPRFTS
ncbi:MAG: hypothetical protein WKG07_12025 [Hymenobacter sp.]